MTTAATTVLVPAHALERGRRDVAVHACRWEGPGQEPAVVCVHGLGGSHLNWTLLGPRLASRATVWAPDLAGFGWTDPAGRSGRLEASVDLLGGFVRTVSPRRPVVLLGNSMGALLAATLAGRQPELAAGVVMLGLTAPPVGRWPDPGVLARFLVASTPGIGRLWLRRRERWLTPAERVRESLEMNTSDPDAVDAALVREQVRLATARRGMPHARSALLAATRTLVARLGPARRRLRADLAAVRAPVLVLHGRDDRLIVESWVSALVAQHPAWRLRLYPGLGHMVMIEAPDRVAGDVATWLDEAVRPGVAPAGEPGS